MFHIQSKGQIYAVNREEKVKEADVREKRGKEKKRKPF